jgi:sarcosine oxidase subunit beta
MRVGIVGGGIHGAATAYFLTEFGDVDVTLFERDALGSGSTGYSAGIVRHHYSNPTHVDLVRRSVEHFQTLGDRINHDSGFHQNGYLVLYDEDHEDDLREIVSIQRDCGLEVRLIEPDEIEEILPGSSPDGVALGAYEPTAGFADPYLVATGYAKAAREAGGTIETGTEVRDVDRQGDTVEALVTVDGRREFDYVVNAAGTAGARVAAMVDVSVPLRLRESKIVTLTADASYGPDLPTLSDHSMSPAMYAKPEPSGDFLVGGINRPWLDDDQPTAGVDEAFVLEVGRRLDRRLPGFADASVVDSWSGRISVTPDSNPIMGEPAGVENFYNMVGGSGHGFKTAPAFAEAAARHILGKEPRFDLSPYRLERFADDDHLTGVSSRTYGEH